ncbi:cytochrome b [Promicromonospora iranensis]|uniref:Cytochrome bc1 complex cytochrome b subunit n=1 Tax=Promicromonospora iranensis TaxID=1105144 RepID=A0ABU2CWJ1_9MICO|nr:cytochrome b N-terminal domain-containing protein [Promicromonospora iranensis]MDR7385694.1 ubiquinol-cytochrome c reductase cytochrome b subunit [Promicromonospora iranensis]
MRADRDRRRTAFLAMLGRRRVQLRWSNLFGVVTFACLIVLAVTGVLLAFWYTPSNELVTYDGPYGPLRGATVTEAFDSTMRISFEQTGGLLVRQTHHWAALVMPASMIVQLLVTFFTGGFRRPRQLSWVLLVVAFILVLVAGWSGYALPDDMLSGTGLRIVEGVVLSIPFIGTWVASWMFGGPFPGQIIENLYPVHAVVAPGLLVLVMVVRGVLSLRHGQAAHPRSAPAASLGLRLWPDAALRAAGMTGMTAAVLVLLGATSTISPVWSYGPASGGEVGAGSQPDWYMGFLDGALRLVPVGWEAEWLGWTVTFATLVPLVVIAGYFAVLIVYPYLEAWVDQDRAPHHVLDRPRNVPVRTGIGVAGVLFYGILWGAASADIVSTELSVPFETIITTLQVALLVGPALAFEVTRRVCIGLQRKDREVALHGHETGRVVRMSNGGYAEIHQPAGDAELALLSVTPVPAAPGRAGGDGRLSGRERLRGALSRRFGTGHVVPVVEHDRVLVAGRAGQVGQADRPAGTESRGTGGGAGSGTDLTRSG